MDKARITSLLEALCERPLADGRAEPADLQAFCYEAAQTLSRSGNAGTGEAADVDRLTAAFAVLLSGVDSEDARRTVEDAVLRSQAARLDAQSAVAFVETLEASPQAAPADLVAELLAADRTAAAGAAGGSTEGRGAWSLLAGTSWSARRWRMAAACIVVIAVGGASWTAFLPRTSPDSTRPPAAKAAIADAPAPAESAPPALATARPCKPDTGLAAARAARKAEDADLPPSAPDAACAADSQVADRPEAERSRTVARERAETAAREAAAARAAAGAASQIGAAQADRERNGGTLQADQSGPLFGGPGRNPAAAAVPAAPPAGLVVRPAAPVGAQ